MVEEIKRKVQEEANKRTGDIVLAVYGNMLKSHQEYCGCNYCKLLTRYISLKKRLSKRRKRQNDPEFDFLEGSWALQDIEETDEMRRQIKLLKREKDNLKRIQ